MADFGGDGIRLRGLSGKRLEEQQKKNLEDYLKEPVSYTHLTLPTICSV